MCEDLKSLKVDCSFVETNILREQSTVARLIFYLHCKERAVEDLILGLRDTDMPATEMLKVQRNLAKK